jgi:predicted ATPase
LIYALAATSVPHLLVGNYASVNAQTDEAVATAEEIGEVFWKEMGAIVQGYVLALTGKASEAVHQITSGIAASRSMGATVWLPKELSYLAKAYAELGQFEDAWRCSEEAITHIETTKERWWEAEVYRIAGEIALLSPEPDAAKAQMYFERALTVARKQQAKSWELRAATSMARLWRDQGKRKEARDLLAPVYGWFTEGFDTLDLKEAKALLDELAA